MGVSPELHNHIIIIYFIFTLQKDKILYAIVCYQYYIVHFTFTFLRFYIGAYYYSRPNTVVYTVIGRNSRSPPRAALLLGTPLPFLFQCLVIDYDSRTMCTSFDDCSKYWIGLRNQLGRLVWTDGSTLSKNISFWEEQIPSDLQTLPCVHLNLNENLYELSGYWENEDCGMPRRYICKKGR